MIYRFLFNSYQPCRKCGTAAAAAAIVGGVGALVGSAQYADARHDQMKHDDEMFEKQKEFELQKFNMTNEYNSFVNQKQRAVNAGFNPALLASSGNLGISNSQGIGSPSQGANQLPMSQTPSFMDSFGGVLQNASVASLQQSQKDNVDAQTRGQDIANEWLPLQNEADLAYKFSRAKHEGVDVSKAEKELEYLDKTINDRVKSVKLDNQLKSLNAKYLKLQAETEKLKPVLMSSEVGLNKAQANDVVKTLSWRIGALRNQAFQDAADGVLKESQMITEESLRTLKADLEKAYTESIKNMTFIEREKFNDVWLKYIIPMFGSITGAGSSLYGSWIGAQSRVAGAHILKGN